ncbi:MAG TPA: HlyC/CorC family transporter [Dehalococcoidia bacterium]|nr:HlyC/CorC family transporter [Dehalococcoidia bacterium]
MSEHDVLYLILFGCCLLFSAFFSSSETAFFSMQRVRLKYLIDNQVKRALSVNRMLDQPARLLSIILLGNNLVNVAASALATSIAIKYLPEDHGVLIATIVTTILLLIFAETIPKTIATHHAEKLSLFFVRPIEFISWLFAPFVISISWLTSLFTRLIGISSIPKTLFSADEIRTMITAGHQEGEVGEPEAKMLNKVFDFSDRLAREVMVPRTDVIAIEQGSTLADFFTLFIEYPRSRFPVYSESMDNVTGILVAKDIFIAQAKGELTTQSIIDSLVRPAYFTPEIKHINSLFADMKETNNQIAIVVDEFGGTEGIVSLNGLVEEIVGDMGDELVSPDEEFRIIDDYTFYIGGSMRIEEANEEMQLDLPVSDSYETVAGFVLSLLGHIPEVNEKVDYMNLRFTVTEMQGFRINTVRVTRERQKLNE